jgi:hypothetical protein
MPFIGLHIADLHCFLRNAAATLQPSQLSVSQRWSMRDLHAYQSMNMRRSQGM